MWCAVTYPCGQPDLDPGAAQRGGVVGRHRAAVRVHERGDDRETEARAGLLGRVGRPRSARAKRSKARARMAGPKPGPSSATSITVVSRPEASAEPSMERTDPHLASLRPPSRC